MNTFCFGLLLLATQLTFPGASRAATSPENPPSSSRKGIPAGKETDSLSGEIKAIDKDAGYMMIQHGFVQLPNYVNMPPMTMAFHVAKAEMLDRVKVGDKVVFKVKEINHVLTITKLEANKSTTGAK